MFIRGSFLIRTEHGFRLPRNDQLFIRRHDPYLRAGFDSADFRFSSAHIVLVFIQQQPGKVTTVMRKDLRRGKVFVDWSQNDSHKTTCAVYSLRARAEPTVSTPLTWREVETAAERRDAARLTFRAEQVLERVAREGDLFAPVLKLKQRLP